VGGIIGSHVLKFGFSHKGFRSYEVLNLGGAFCPKFSGLSSSENMPCTRTHFQVPNGSDLIYQHAKFGGARISHAAGGGAKKFDIV